MSYKAIANALGYEERQVRGWINNHCAKKNRSFNDGYFDCIDSAVKAYFLGYIFADGWVSLHGDNNRTNPAGEFAMQLQRNDRYILERLNNELGGVHLIKDIESHGIIANNKTVSHTQSSVLRVFSNKIVRSLIALNITPNKSYSDKYPIVSDTLFADFLRGYFDGDGCVCANRHGMAQVSFTAYGRTFLCYLQEKLKNMFDIRSSVYMENERKYRLVIFRYDDVRTFFSAIYQDPSSFRLMRKYEKAKALNGLVA